MSRVASNEKGQSLLEFAVFLPIVLVMLLVVLDFAMAADRKEVLDHAIREGARAAALGDSVAAITAQTVSQSEGNIEAADVSVCYEDIDGNGLAGDAGDNVRIEISHAFTFSMGGELLTALGLGSPSVDMGPVAHAPLLEDVGVAPGC